MFGISDSGGGGLKRREEEEEAGREVTGFLWVVVAGVNGVSVFSA